MGLVNLLQPWDILSIYCNNQLKQYITPLLTLASRALSIPLMRSLSEAIFVLFHILMKIWHARLLSNQAWSLVPKLNLLWRSWTQHHSPLVISLSPGSGRSPGEGNGSHSSILAWRVPWTEEPCGLQSRGSQRVGHGWVTDTFLSWCLNMVNHKYNKAKNLETIHIHFTST